MIPMNDAMDVEITVTMVIVTSAMNVAIGVAVTVGIMRQTRSIRAVVQQMHQVVKMEKLGGGTAVLQQTVWWRRVGLVRA